MRLVLDASAAVRLVMRAVTAERLLKAVADAAVVIAPSLYVSEVANALYKYVRAGDLDMDTALERYEEAMDLVDDFTPDRELTTEALTEAARYGHPVYDLLYVVLARRSGSTVLTLDQRLKTLLDRTGIDAFHDLINDEQRDG
ncbi:MAG: type II toxin-antitoxin system VapC family toxin [Candidatus Thiosymbion ectosymbiont of Robbea hypermnestra]|nr:type II toxin-antitoxin system VapC family toxin [Candidatus Thiosymbion ectosymbiont of Robbea hypermnestra]